MAHDAAFEFEDSVYMFHGGSQVRYQKGASKAFKVIQNPLTMSRLNLKCFEHALSLHSIKHRQK